MTRVLLAGLLVATTVIAQTPVAAPGATAPRFNRITLEVTDPEAEVKFWTAVGGASRELETAHGRITLVEFQDLSVAVRRGGGREGTVGSVIDHIGVQVPNTQEGVARFQAAGLNPTAGGSPVQAWLMSPSQVRVEILQEPELRTPVRGHHVHFFSPAPLQMQAWYAKHFGAVPGKRGNFEAADLAAGTKVINFTFGRAEKALAPTAGRVLDRLGITVPNLDRFLQNLQKRGVRVIPGTSMIEDPWGTRIELLEAQAP